MSGAWLGSGEGILALGEGPVGYATAGASGLRPAEGEKVPVDPAAWIQPTYPAADGILDDLEESLP